MIESGFDRQIDLDFDLLRVYLPELEYWDVYMILEMDFDLSFELTIYSEMLIIQQLTKMAFGFGYDYISLAAQVILIHSR